MTQGTQFYTFDIFFTSTLTIMRSVFEREAIVIQINQIWITIISIPQKHKVLWLFERSGLRKRSVKNGKIIEKGNISLKEVHVNVLTYQLYIELCLLTHSFVYFYGLTILKCEMYFLFKLPCWLQLIKMMMIKNKSWNVDYHC